MPVPMEKRDDHADKDGQGIIGGGLSRPMIMEGLYRPPYLLYRLILSLSRQLQTLVNEGVLEVLQKFPS
jgi:hypothetical protein